MITVLTIHDGTILRYKLRVNDRSIYTSIYPLVNVYVTMERSTIFHGKTHYFNGPFSIAFCMFTRGYNPKYQGGRSLILNILNHSPFMVGADLRRSVAFSDSSALHFGNVSKSSKLILTYL